MPKIIEHPLNPDLNLFFAPPEFTRIFGENFDYGISNYKKILERVGSVVEDPSFVGSIGKSRIPTFAVSLAHTACDVIEKNLKWTWCNLEFVDSQVYRSEFFLDTKTGVRFPRKGGQQCQR